MTVFKSMTNAELAFALRIAKQFPARWPRAIEALRLEAFDRVVASL